MTGRPPRKASRLARGKVKEAIRLCGKKRKLSGTHPVPGGHIEDLSGKFGDILIVDPAPADTDKSKPSDLAAPIPEVEVDQH